jgi:hypothetical protein
MERLLSRWLQRLANRAQHAQPCTREANNRERFIPIIEDTLNSNIKERPNAAEVRRRFLKALDDAERTMPTDDSTYPPFLQVTSEVSPSLSPSPSLNRRPPRATIFAAGMGADYQHHAPSQGSESRPLNHEIQHAGPSNTSDREITDDLPTSPNNRTVGRIVPGIQTNRSHASETKTASPHVTVSETMDWIRNKKNKDLANGSVAPALECSLEMLRGREQVSMHASLALLD